MHIIHLTLGGCMRAPPVAYGSTADTGGHIAYVLNAALAQAGQLGVDKVTIITRRFCDATLDIIHDQTVETINSKTSIIRLGAAKQPYAEKEALAAFLDQLAAEFFAYVASQLTKVSVIHAHFADAMEVAALAADHFSIPLIYTPHALGLDKMVSGIEVAPHRLLQELRAITFANAIVVSTRDEGERQIGAYGVAGSQRKLRRIMPGVPTLMDAGAERGREILTPLLAKVDKPVVLAIARPVAKKNLIGLAHAYASSPWLQKRTNLVIVAGQHNTMRPGSEEYKNIAALHDIRRDAGLLGLFALPDRHDGRDIAGLYRFAALTRGVFVNPALHEPFGLTLLEAASVGLPVVATDRGGPCEILATFKCGILSDPNSSDELVNAIRHVFRPRMYDNYSSAGKAEARRRTWRAYAIETISLYKEFIDAGIVTDRNAG